MKLKHISIVLKLLNFLNISQRKTKIIFLYKKEYLPILYFLKNENFIYNYQIKSIKYIIIFFKSYNNFFFLKKIKVFNFKNHFFKKKIILNLLKRKNLFKFFILYNDTGNVLTLDNSLKYKKGGFLITQLN